jgi:hypothetical protein
MTIDILSPDLKKHATPRQAEYIDAVLKYGSDAKAAVAMGVNRRTVDRAIAAAKLEAVDAGDLVHLSSSPRVLVLDIETAPILANIWQMWQEVRNTEALLSDWYIMTWAAKWLGDKEVISMSMHNTKGYKPGTENDKALLKGMHDLMSEADYIIAHNGDRFDIKKINTRFLQHNIPPPTPYKSIDTLKIAKRYFSFTSNKLDYLAKKLLGDQKMKHDGLKLWQGCVNGDTESWETMLDYNKKDVTLLERVYMKLRAWDHLHPNFAVHTDKDVLSCTVCGSNNVEPTGDTVKTTTGAYLGYVCMDCTHQMRGKTNVRSYTQTQATLRNAK